MSSVRSVIRRWKAIENGDMAGSLTSLGTDISQADNVGIQATWSGTSPVGEMKVDASNDEGVTWTEMSFTPVAAVSGNTGSILMSAPGVGYSQIRVRYVRTSGTGTLQVRLTAKGS